MVCQRARIEMAELLELRDGVSKVPLFSQSHYNLDPEIPLSELYRANCSDIETGRVERLNQLKNTGKGKRLNMEPNITDAKIRGDNVQYNQTKIGCLQDSVGWSQDHNSKVAAESEQEII